MKNRNRYAVGSGQLLRLRLLGWYGFHSTGDDLMRWCIERIFQERAIGMGMSLKFTNDDDCDLCIIGGGTIIGCDTSRICNRVDKINAPLTIFGPGFRNTGEDECKRWQPKMRSLFERSLFSGVRGPRTAESLKHYGMVEDVDIIGDSAIGFEPVPLPWRADGPVVGICVRTMKNAEVGMEERYISSRETFNRLASVISLVLERLAARPVFLSFAENKFDSDSEAARRLRAILPSQYHNASILPYCDDVRLNPSIVGQLDYLISERMHPAIIAWLMGKPCVMIENQYGKSTDFMASINMERYCLRTDELDNNRYMGLFDDIMNNRKNIVIKTGKLFDILKKRQSRFVDKLLKKLNY